MRKNMSKDRNLAENHVEDNNLLNMTKLKNAKSIGCKNLKTNARGITLIALVITVIVLLILAGVSISAITGNESAMEKAKQAKTANEAADELDSVKLAVVDAVAHGTTGYVTLQNLNTALSGLGLTATEGSGDDVGKFIVNGNKGTYKISANGAVEVATGATMTPASIEFTDASTETKTRTRTITLNPTEGLTITNVVWGSVANSAITLTPSADNKSATVTLGTANVDLATNGETITATVTTSDGQTSELSCKVTYKESTITKINVKTTSVTVAPDKTATIEVEGLGALGSKIALTGSEGIKYTSNATATATVSTDGSTFGQTATSNTTNPSSATVKGIAEGTTYVTVTCSGKTILYNGESSGNVGVTVQESYITDTYSWTDLSAIAKLISDKYGAETNPISNTDESATVTYNSNQVTLNVGDKAKLKYNGTETIVRIIGFNHDDLESSDAYVANGTNTKAGITFEFVDIIGEGTMKVDKNNTGGWGASDMKTTLSTTYLPLLTDLSATPVQLQMSIIKSVKKPYLAGPWETTVTTPTTGDKLWLSSCEEVYGDKKYAYTVEGSQYKYFDGKSDSDFKKKNGSSYADWWLRSIPYQWGTFCSILNDGSCYHGAPANGLRGVSPGFSI